MVLEFHPGSTSLGDRANAADILLSIGEVAYVWQIATDGLVWSASVCDVLRVSNRELPSSGSAYAKLLTPDSRRSRDEAVLKSPLTDEGAGVPYRVQYHIHGQPGGPPVLIEDRGRWFAGPDCKPGRAHGVVRAIGHENSREGGYDELTGELNRRNLTEELASALDEAFRLRKSIGFLVVSIDDLARVNEAYGFGVGDEVIVTCAGRLRAAMRANDHLGRISGNKFGAVLRDCNADDLMIAANRFIAAIRDGVVRTTTGPVAVTSSVGGVIAPRHGQNVHEIVSRAHEALSTGKNKRRGGTEIFRPNAARDALRRENMRASDDIIGALNDRRIIAAFEPVADAKSRQPAFNECLMRIQRTDGGLVSATEIMPVAERLGLVRLIDHRMLELAIAEFASIPDIRLSLNVSPSSTTDGPWWSALLASLAGHPEFAQRLTIELTESEAIRNIDEARAFVKRLKQAGCRIAIDDFGAGYSSFRNIRDLGVDIIKIDGGFIKDLATSADNQAFVRTMLELAGHLGLETVAEWVQDEASAALLAAWGCDYLQGALIGTATLDPPWRMTTASASRQVRQG